MRKLFLVPMMICIVGCSLKVSPTTTQTEDTKNTAKDSIARDLYADWKTYSESFSTYKEVSFRYPADWTLYKDSHMLNFVINGETYNFGYYMGTEVDADSVNRSLEIYDGINFVRSEFIKQGKTFLIVYEVNPYRSESTFDIYDGIQGTIPPVNSDSYIKLFDEIMKSIKIKKN